MPDVKPVRLLVVQTDAPIAEKRRQITADTVKP
jgi:hypothetical protein